MSGFVYLKGELTPWIVGFYKPDGGFQPVSEHGSEQAAVDRTIRLNGGQPPEVDPERPPGGPFIDVPIGTVAAYLTAAQQPLYVLFGYARDDEAEQYRLHCMGCGTERTTGPSGPATASAADAHAATCHRVPLPDDDPNRPLWPAI